MRILTLCSLIIFVCLSCKENKKEHVTIVNSENNLEQKFNAYCFFKLDDKYSTEKDSLVINSWLKEKSLLILTKDSLTNIFSQNGGGPNGSQWNPATDLYVATVTSSLPATKTPKLYINGKLSSKQIYKYNSNLTWYVVKKDFWEKEIRKINSTDMQKLYSPELLNEIKENNYHSIEYLTQGKILKFEIANNKEKLTKFFHATNGE